MHKMATTMEIASQSNISSLSLDVAITIVEAAYTTKYQPPGQYQESVRIQDICQAMGDTEHSAPYPLMTE